MNMQITGIVHKILVMESGTSARGYWQKQQFIIKTKDSYPKEVCITAWGDKVDLVPTTLGKDITVNVNPSSKEYNNRWSTELGLWSVVGVSKSKAPTNSEEDSENLPF